MLAIMAPRRRTHKTPDTDNGKIYKNQHFPQTETQSTGHYTEKGDRSNMSSDI